MKSSPTQATWTKSSPQESRKREPSPARHLQKTLPLNTARVVIEVPVSINAGNAQYLTYDAADSEQHFESE